MAPLRSAPTDARGLRQTYLGRMEQERKGPNMPWGSPQQQLLVRPDLATLARATRVRPMRGSSSSPKRQRRESGHGETTED